MKPVKLTQTKLEPETRAEFKKNFPSKAKVFKYAPMMLVALGIFALLGTIKVSQTVFIGLIIFSAIYIFYLITEHKK